MQRTASTVQLQGVDKPNAPLTYRVDAGIGLCKGVAMSSYIGRSIGGQVMCGGRNGDLEGRRVVVTGRAEEPWWR